MSDLNNRVDNIGDSARKTWTEPKIEDIAVGNTAGGGGFTAPEAPMTTFTPPS